MAEIQLKPLGLLDRVYRFLGAEKAVSRVSLERDITLVHDVSRYAERAGRPYHGYVDLIYTYTTGAATGKIAYRRHTNFQTKLGFNSEEYELWVLGIGLRVKNGDEGKLTKGMFFHGVNASVSADHDRKVIVIGDSDYFTPMGIWSMATADLHAVYDEVSGATPYWTAAFTPEKPIRTEPYGFVGWGSQTGGATEMVHWWQMWSGPFGTTPPGAG